MVSRKNGSLQIFWPKFWKKLNRAIFDQNLETNPNSYHKLLLRYSGNEIQNAELSLWKQSPEKTLQRLALDFGPSDRTGLRSQHYLYHTVTRKSFKNSIR